MRTLVGHLVAVTALLATALLQSSPASANCEADPEMRPARLAYLFSASDYDHDEYYPDLPSTSDDLAALSSVLCDELGFQVRVFEQARQADLEELKDRIPEDIDSISGGGPALVLVLFLGHGLSDYGVNYLAPTDARPRPTNESPIDAGLVGTEYLLSVLKQNNIAVGMLLVDACRSAPSRGSAVRRHSLLGERGMSAALRPEFVATSPALNPQTLVSYSTKLGREAIVPQTDGLGAYVASLVQELPQEGQTVQNAFRDVSIKVRAATDGRSRPMEPELMVGELSSEAYINPNEEQRERIDRAFRNALLTQNKNAIREVAIDYPLAPLIAEAHAWCRQNGCAPSRLDASAGVVRIEQGCRFVQSGYDCNDLTNAFGNLNQPVPRRPSEALFVRRPELAHAERVLVEPLLSGGVAFTPIKSPATLSENRWVTQKRISQTRIPRESIKLIVDDALNPAVWNRDHIGLHPCSVSASVSVCASVLASRFSQSAVRRGSFEVLAVARKGSAEDKTARLRQASEFAVAVMAELVRMGAEPSRVSYYVADESFHPAFSGLAFVRSLRRS